jgi:VCBS repeat protein
MGVWKTRLAIAALTCVAACGAFAATRHIPLPAGFRPAAIAVADFNGDGAIDIAIAGLSERLLILLGDGHGGLHAARESARAGKQPIAMVAADVNGDHKIDLVIANHDTDHLTLLIGDGKGQFTAREIRVPSKPHPHMVAVADVDGDGRPEMITDSWMENRLLIVKTDGRSTPIEVGRKPYFTLTAADLDGDGHIDLVTPNEGLGTVSILFGDGHGHFAHAPQSPIAAGPEPFSATVADVNGDGRPDIIIANYSGQGTDLSRGGITWIRNDGARRFTAFPQRVVAGRQMARLTAGDFDGDGFTDVAASNSSSADVTIVFGSRSGLRRSITVPTMQSPHAVAFADLDRDGRADLLVISEEHDELLVIPGHP